MRLKLLKRKTQFKGRKRLFTIVCLCLCSLVLNANVLESQINLSLNNSTLKQAFFEIKQQSGVSIIYSNKVINDKVRVTLEEKDISLEDALTLLLSNQKCSFIIENGQVMLVPVKTSSGSGLPSVAQQGITVKGTVKDQYNEAVIGASVVVKGTTTGTVTDFDGNFEIPNVPEGAVISVSYVGFASKEIKASSNILRIVLEESAVGLDQIVVVGFGTQKKVNLTGSVANVDNELLENRPVTSVSAALQGLLPGVAINQRQGRPGGDGGTIRVRGVGTFNNATPMVLLDGVESSISQVDQISPEDIENISVLKDAASSAIYGSKAANGVILVTTKRGKTGKAQISYSANFGWSDATRLPKLLSSADYAELYNEALRNDGREEIYTAEMIQKFRDGSDPDNYPNTDWMGLFYTESGFQHTHNVNITGGSDAVRYMVSVGYQGQKGLIRHENKDRYNYRLNLDANPTERLELNASVSYTNLDLLEPTNSYVGGGDDQIFRQVRRISPMVPYKKSNGEYGTIGDGNPIAWLDLGGTINKKRHYMLSSGSLKYSIWDGLAIKGVASYKLYVEDSNEFIKDIQYNASKYHGPSKMYQKDNIENTVYGDILLTYDKNFGMHNLSVLAGFHSELFQKKYTEAYRQDFPSTEVGDINAGSTSGMQNKGYTRELAMMSWLGRVNYDYMGKYLFEANIRYDGTSRFAKGNRWGAFPSVSAGWRISEEEFFEGLKTTVDNLKVRASWGKLGNQSVLDSDNAEWYYPTVPPFTVGENYGFGGSINTGGAVKNAINPYLQWESTTSWGIGLDLTLLNRVNITMDYYDKKTSDILMTVATPSTYALSNFIDNVGSMVNRGFELAIQYNERLGNVDFNIGGNLAYNKNKILDLGLESIPGENYQQIIGSDNRIKRTGYAINSYFGYKTAGLYQSQADIDSWPEYKITGAKVQPGDLKYVNANGDEVLDTNDRVVLGSEEPKFTFGFNLGAKYKGFDVVALFQGAAGVYRYINGEVVGEINGDDTHPSSFWNDRWRPDHTNTDVPRVSVGSGGASFPNRISDYWYQNASYVRLKNIQVGYTFAPSLLSKIGISKLRLYYSGQNLLTFTGFVDGFDPEVASGRASHYPQTKTNSFGVNLTF